MHGTSETFGALLRRCRVTAALTQERLAERSGLSVNAIAALEAGRRRSPRLVTVGLLVDALALEPEVAAQLRLLAAGGTTDTGGSTGSPGPTGSSRSVGVAAAGPFPAATHGPGRYAFVGRDRQRRDLVDAWRRRVRLVLVSGEAGVGKTRLVGQLGELAAPSSVVLWGRCTPDRLGAYEPWVEPLRQATALVDVDEPLAAELTRVLPELAFSGRAGRPSVADPGVERRLLFEAVGRLLAAVGPAVLAIDDLHWADAASLAMLAHVVTNARLTDLVVVATLRSTDQEAATAALLTDLGRRTTLERVALTGLGSAEIGRLVAEIAGDRASDDLVATVSAATAGNPLYVEELTEHLLDQDWHPGGTAETTPLPVPSGVRDTIGQRTMLLSADAQTLLRVGAVLGPRFDVDLAGRLAALDDGALTAAVEDALLSSLVVEESVLALRFSHALVQSAVYEAISGRRRLQLHRAAASALEEQAQAGLPDAQAGLPDAQVYDLARHWGVVSAADPGAAPQAAHWARRAGDAAAAAADIDQAIARYERAAVLWQGSTTEYAQTLLSLGSALSARGQRAEAEARFRSVMALADGIGDVTLFARAAVGLSADVQYGISDPDKIAALERSLAELPPDQHVLKVTAAAMLKRQLGFDASQDAYARRQAAAAVVLDAVSGDDLSHDLLLSLSASRDAIVVDDPVVLRRLSLQMIEAATAQSNLLVMANARYSQAWAALELADSTAWAEAVAAFGVVADQLGLGFELAMASTMASTTALIGGDYAGAAAHALRARDLAHGIDPNADAIHLTHQVLSGLDLGRAAPTLELMLTVREQLDAVPTFQAGLALTAACAGATDVAGEVLDAFARNGFATIRQDLEWLPVVGLLSHTCAMLGRREQAGELYDLLSSHPARAVRVGPLSAFWGPTDFHLAALNGLLDRDEEAESRLRRAIATCTEIGARPWLARCQIELARLLDRTGASDSRREADALRSVALETARGLHAEGIASLVDG